ncbi:hypothetical protein BMS3Abin15_00685 [bacterium BMS3Abin15]|nr:hypothetical protein BMS3Abin15_00685 [bacterium BMS3Abin15]HDZ85804.1 hypothetical protein [Candidatus Moranbacteria bacterium]
MPVIITYGVPDDFSEEKLKKLLSNLCGAVQGELRIGVGEVSAFFPRDRIQEGLGEEIIIFVKGFFDKPERTEDIRSHIAKMLVEKTKAFFPKALVECFIEPFNPKQGFRSMPPQ